MPTRFQKAIKLPVHFELAIRHSPVRLDGRRAGMSTDLKQFHARVSEYLPTESKLRQSRILDSGQDEFYNSVQWAVKQLKAEKKATGISYSYFEASSSGFGELHHDILLFLCSLWPEQLDVLLSHLDSEGVEIFVRLLRLAPTKVLEKVVATQATRRQLFVEAFRNLPVAEMLAFIEVARAPMRDLMGHYLITQYRLAPVHSGF
jgi:hypothetical protein